MAKEVEHIGPKVVVKRSRPGRGLGLFVLEPVKKGAFVIEYIGRKIPTSLADTLTTRYLFEIDEEWTIDGSEYGNKARYANHSCVPNCESEIENGRVIISAIRNIKAGEEITYDYGEEYFKEFIQPAGCKCEKCAPELSVANK